MSCRGHRSKNWVLINAKNKVGPKEYSRNSDESASGWGTVSPLWLLYNLTSSDNESKSSHMVFSRV